MQPAPQPAPQPALRPALPPRLAGTDTARAGPAGSSIEREDSAMTRSNWKEDEQGLLWKNGTDGPYEPRVIPFTVAESFPAAPASPERLKSGTGYPPAYGAGMRTGLASSTDAEVSQGMN